MKMKKLFKLMAWIQKEKIQAMIHCGRGFN
jgi:hypothetical protein